MSSFNTYDPEHPVNHAWGSALRYLSSAPARMEDGGVVQDASGWKVAKLRDPFLGKFEGYAFGSYSLNDSARCAKNRKHESPHAGCDCGFYAMKERHRAVFLMERWRSMVLLKVEMYGVIHEHRDGYRSQEQEVVSMAIPARCGRGWCRGTTTGMSKSRTFWRSACDQHLKGTCVTLAQMRSAMALDVVLLDASN